MVEVQEVERCVSAFVDAKAQAVHAFVLAQLNAGRVSDSVYRSAVAHFGERGVMELVAITGYYTLVSFTLNTFELGLPEGAAPELADPEFPATSIGDDGHSLSRRFGAGHR